MKQPDDKKRALAAAKTRKKILRAASALFLKKGFDGVSISEIAKAAEINQSLIYHYFESKEGLWKEVKNHLTAAHHNSASSAPEVHPGQSLREILKQIIYSRYNLYAKNPDIVRLMSWQRLESSKEKLMGGTPFSPDTWKPIFHQLQQQGQIRAGVDLDLMILFIVSAVSGAYIEEYKENLITTDKIYVYLEMIVDSCMSLLAEGDVAKKGNFEA